MRSLRKNKLHMTWLSLSSRAADATRVVAPVWASTDITDAALQQIMCTSVGCEFIISQTWRILWRGWLIDSCVIYWGNRTQEIPDTQTGLEKGLYNASKTSNPLSFEINHWLFRHWTCLCMDIYFNWWYQYKWCKCLVLPIRWKWLKGSHRLNTSG